MYKQTQKIRLIGTQNSSVTLFFKYYWHRIFGAAFSWFFWDITFFGNKLFQSSFIKIIDPGATLISLLKWSSINSFVALSGYIFAAFLVDKPYIGRLKL